MNIITFILFGLIVGFISNALDPQPTKGGIKGALMLGVLGSIIGGILGNVLFGIDILGYNFATLSVAVLMALMALLVSREIFKGSKNPD